jgi:hypothetical protein
LNHFYDLVLENTSEIYVIYEQDYDIVNITDVVYSKDIGSYVTNLVLKSKNPSWFDSYSIDSYGIRIIFKNPENGEKNTSTISCYKVKIK